MHRTGLQITLPFTPPTTTSIQQSGFLYIPFVGDLTTQLVKKLKRKIRRWLIDANVLDIRIKEKTTKLCFFTSTKDKTPPLRQSNVVYKFTCPGCCHSSYIGKTNRTLLVRTKIALYINICAIVIKSDTYKVYTTYRTFLPMITTHLLLQWTKNFLFKPCVVTQT